MPPWSACELSIAAETVDPRRYLHGRQSSAILTCRHRTPTRRLRGAANVQALKTRNRLLADPESDRGTVQLVRRDLFRSRRAAAPGEGVLMVRIVSWNLGERPPGKPKAWSYLQDLEPDIALVQEAVVPAGLDSVHRAGGIAGRDGKARRWNSAVVAFGGRATLTPVGLAEGTWRGRRQGVAPIDCVSRGHVAIAKAELPGWQATVISTYGLMEFGYASGTMLRTLADLEPLLDDPELGRSVLLAGDWNIGTWWGQSDAKYAEREGAFLQLLGAYGFVDCLDRHISDGRGRLEGCTCEHGDGCRHLATFRRNGVPYTDDYVFATRSLADTITTARIAPEWTWQVDLSDHAPLVVDCE